MFNKPTFGADEPTEPTQPLDRPITSWEDILDDTDWLFDDDDESDAGAQGAQLTDADRSALRQQFALADVVAGLVNSINHITSQPTSDFEYHYQAGYEAFAQASAHLEQERQRVDAAGAEFQPIIDELRADLDRQHERLAEYFEDHADRHRRYQEAMVSVRSDMARDNQRAAQERLQIQRETSKVILDGQAAAHKKRVEAFDKWNRTWLDNHLR